MKKLFLIIVFLLSCLSVFPKVYDEQNIEMVHYADARRYVCNPCYILSADSVALMDSLLYALERSTGIEVAVVAVDSVKNGDCYETALHLAQKHGVGKSETNNGLVVLLSTSDRCILFCTGSGLEGYLPDALCKRIQRRYMNDAFSAGQWDAGMTAGIRAVCSTLDGTMEWHAESDGEMTLSDYLLVLITVLLFPLVLAWNSYRAKKCPNCGKHKMKRVERQRVRSNFYETEYMDTYVCSNCGHRCNKVWSVRNGGGSAGGGGFFGGRTGGGHMGGSFGGGHFGGGGSGSRF